MRQGVDRAFGAVHIATKAAQLVAHGTHGATKRIGAIACIPNLGVDINQLAANLVKVGNNGGAAVHGKGKFDFIDH